MTQLVSSEPELREALSVGDPISIRLENPSLAKNPLWSRLASARQVSLAVWKSTAADQKFLLSCLGAELMSLSVSGLNDEAIKTMELARFPVLQTLEIYGQEGVSESTVHELYARRGGQLARFRFEESLGNFWIKGFDGRNWKTWCER